MLYKGFIPTKAYDDYLEFKQNRFPEQSGNLLVFHGVDGHDVYNTTVPFVVDGRTVMAGRVERRDSENAQTMFFEEKRGEWHLIPEATCVPGLQDPFVSWIDNAWVLGGIHAIWREDGSLVTYHADFYRIMDLSTLMPILEGPPMMKDIRLHQLSDGRIAVFSRPQGDAMKHLNRVAAIGFGIVEKLESLTAEWIAELPLLEGHFRRDEWGGYNQLLPLAKGMIGCIGHKSWGEMVGEVFVIHYYCFAQVFDPMTKVLSPIQVIGSRDCFPDAPQKNPRAYDVCFTSGIIWQEDGKALLYTGLSDAHEGVLEIPDPFLTWQE